MWIAHCLILITPKTFSLVMHWLAFGLHRMSSSSFILWFIGIVRVLHQTPIFIILILTPVRDGHGIL